VEVCWLDLVSWDFSSMVKTYVVLVDNGIWSQAESSATRLRALGVGLRVGVRHLQIDNQGLLDEGKLS